MATDPEIEFGAAQGADTDTVALSGYLDGALGLAARFQIVAQPLGGKLTLGQTSAGEMWERCGDMIPSPPVRDARG
jgi:hypothetical protein